MDKIKVKSITITRAEGPSRLCGQPVTVKSWEDASNYLYSQSSTFPGPEGGYDKHDIIITFEDGDTYTGRLDCKQASCNNNDLDPRKHVKDCISFYTGKRKPAWMSEADYERSLQGVDRQEYIDYLNKYDI